MNAIMKGWIDEWNSKWIEVDREISSWMGRWINGWMNRPVGEWMKRWPVCLLSVLNYILMQLTIQLS